MAELEKLLCTDSKVESLKKINDIIDNMGTGTGLQMFDTILKDHILTYEESQGLALQGTYVYKTALAGSRYGYPDFYAKCLEEFKQATTTETVNGVTVKVHSNGHKFYNIADKTGIDEFFNSIGSAWFYGVDTANERIFLPRDNFFAIKGIAPVIGNGMTLGLTDGYSNFGVEGTYTSNAYCVSAEGLYGTTVGSAVINSTSSNHSWGVTTDPTKSGIEAHLTPKENKYLYICVGNTTNYKGISDVVNQGMEILDQINAGFVPKDSMQEVPCVVETYVNGTSWYRVWSDGWIEQGARSGSNTKLTITLLKPFSNNNYMVTCSGLDAGFNNSDFGHVASTSETQITLYAANGGNYIWYACGY